uniref:TolC family protein n=1 Tax=Alistipes ihumii TaxID=1470347 RepID=UPI003AB7487F
MKRIPIILFFLVLAPAASAQRSIDEVLRQVENASRELEAQRQLTAAQKQDAATGKYMANPTVEMEKMWGAAGAGQNTELAVVQTIDFPTVYGSRNRIAKLKGSLYEKQWESQRQQLLLQAKQLCIEIVYLYRQRDLLDERLSNAERLSEAYRRKMETGDATSLEANKIAVESIPARTAADLNRAELQAKI